MTTPIYHFFHVLAKNHWRELVADHIDNLVTSGLYERLASMEIGFIGNSDERAEMIEMIKGYPKMRVATFSDDPKQYEFLTLRLIEIKLAQEKTFYIYYSHGKGCSFGKDHPAHTGGRTWFDYMEYFNCTKWKNAVRVLDFGYQSYGVKLWDKKTSPSQTLHYSGNSFWATSDYAKTWGKINDINTADRFGAETQLCGKNSPIAFTACQLFIDYTCKETFQELLFKGKVKELI